MQKYTSELQLKKLYEKKGEANNELLLMKRCQMTPPFSPFNLANNAPNTLYTANNEWNFICLIFKNVLSIKINYFMCFLGRTASRKKTKIG